MKIKVAHIVQSLEVGGLEKVLVDLITNSNKDLFLHSVICLENKGGFGRALEEKGFTVIELKKSGISIPAVIKIMSFLKDNAIDIVHTHNVGPLLYGVIAAIFAKVKNRVHSKHGRNIRNNKKNLWINRFCYPFVRTVIAVSKDIALCAQKHENLNPKKIKVITNGIDISNYNKELYKKNTICKEYNIPNDGYIVGIVARLSWEKDIATLIRAFLQFKSTYTDKKIYLLIVGKGNELELLKKLTTKLGLNNEVFFLGEVKNIPKILSVFDIFVLSSVSEGTSITILEAMVMGLPVVATNVGGNPELVEHEQNGLLVKPKNPQEMSKAISSLFMNKDDAVKMGKKGQKKIKAKYGIAKMVEKYEQLYVNIQDKSI